MPSPVISCITDGDFDSELQVAPNGLDRPFQNDPGADVYAKIHERMMEIAIGSYAPRIAARMAVENLIVSSNKFNAAWTLSNVTCAPNVARNPWDGTFTADLLLETVANASHGMSIGGFTYNPYVYVMWAIVKPAGRDHVALFSGAASCIFNITQGTIGAAAGCTGMTPILCDDGYYVIAAYFSTAGGAGTVTLVTALSDTYAGAFVGDITKGVYVAQMQVQPGTTVGPLIITTTVARSVSVPDFDVADLFAFQVAESKPSIGEGELYQFSRTFARIPANQVKPGSVNFVRPVIHGVKSGTAFGVAFDEDQSKSWIFTSRKAVSSLTAPDVTKTTDTNTKALLPGGQTVSCSGTSGSGSFSTSDSISTIQAALAAAWGFAWILVTKDAFGISVTLTYSGAGGGRITALGTSSSSIEISGPPDNFKITAKDTAAASVRPLHVVGHGGVAGDRLAVWNGDKLIGMGTVVAVGGADDITCELSVVPGKDDVVTHVAFSTDAAMCVVNGPKICDTRRTTRFYLPGYTEGIATDADIPKQVPQIDAISWLAAIIAGTAWPVYEVGDVGQYLGSSLQQETTTLQLSDAVDTVTP
jgi:hypothetical protein